MRILDRGSLALDFAGLGFDDDLLGPLLEVLDGRRPRKQVGAFRHPGGGPDLFRRWTPAGASPRPTDQEAMGRAARRWHHRRWKHTMEHTMPQPNDLSRSLTALDQDSTLIAVIEMSQANWLVGAIVPGIERHPLKKLAPDAEALLRLVHRWRDEATRAGRTIRRIAVAFEAGRDGFWLARWRRARDIEAH